MNRLPLYLTSLSLLFLVSHDYKAQTQPETQVSLVNNPTSHVVPASLRGVNQTAKTSLNYVFNYEFLNEFTAIKPGTMRFPGGTFANSYDWQLELNNNNVLNLKKTIELADSVGSEINYVINYGTTTPGEAAELVHILNDPSPYYAELRESYFGVSDPINIKYWELGNELAAKWEWHVSWVAGGANQQIFYRTGEPSLPMPRSTTDYMHYYGGEIWRKGWVHRWGDGMSVYNSILGSLYKVTAQDAINLEAIVDIEFGTILSSEVIIWHVSDASLSSIDYNQMCDEAVESPCHALQQEIYDAITAPSNVLDASQYTISSDSSFVTIHDVDPLQEGQLILIEYNTHHSGAFDIRNAMKEADPSIEIGYCIDFRDNLLNTANFNTDLTESPPDFLIEHPYNKNTDLAVNNDYLSEVINLVDQKISNEFIPNELELDEICSSLGIPEIGLALTEWNIRLCGDGGCNAAYSGILGGLYTANFFSQTYQAEADEILDLRLSNHFAGVASGNNLIHMWHFNENTLQITPQSEATRLVNDVIGDHMLHSSQILITDNPEIEIILFSTDSDGNNVYTPSSVEALKIYASDDVINNSLEFLILNNDDESSHSVEIQLPCDRLGVDAIFESLSGDIIIDQFLISTSTITQISETYTFEVPSFSICTLKIPYSSSVSSCSCFADFNENGVVDTNDFLDLLSEFGCLTNCNYDLNADGIVTSDDVIIFLSLFSESCN